MGHQSHCPCLCWHLKLQVAAICGGGGGGGFQTDTACDSSPEIVCTSVEVLRIESVNRFGHNMDHFFFNLVADFHFQ